MWTRVWIFANLATDHQHRDDDRHLPDAILVQNTQNRDTEAIQLKLDELIRANQNARNLMLKLEDLTEDDLKRLKDSFTAIGRQD